MRAWIIALLLSISFPWVAWAYSDVPENTPYKTAIDFLGEKGVVSGYADGTFKPSARINRAEFVKIVIGAALPFDPNEPEGSPAPLFFTDLETNAWYTPYLRRAVGHLVISGYPDGTFKPAQTITLVEATKILAAAFSIPLETPQGDEWYSPSLETFAGRSLIPSSFKSLSQPVTRGEMAEMVWRILEKKADQPSASLAVLQDPCVPLGEELPVTVNVAKMREAWLRWMNDARAEKDLPPYIYNDQLDRSALIWSTAARDRGIMDHRRTPGDAYYDYAKIQQWFKDLGLEFKNVNRVTFTENVGWGVYRCDKADCTAALINAIHTTFSFYMQEKQASYRPHYNSIMNAYFKQIGLGIALDEAKEKYYLTVHYGTEITSNPPRICPR